MLCAFVAALVWHGGSADTVVAGPFTRVQLQHQIVLTPTSHRPLPLAISAQVAYNDPSRAPRSLSFRITVHAADTVQYVGWGGMRLQPKLRAFIVH